MDMTALRLALLLGFFSRHFIEGLVDIAPHCSMS